MLYENLEPPPERLFNASPAAWLQIILGRQLLCSFVRFAREQGAKCVTTKLALRWAMLPVNITQTQRARRLGVVRGFAEYVRLLEPRTEVPPQKLIPFRVHRPEPYLYSDKTGIGAMLM